jgi:mono/diheme cytochrome c family protein
VGGALILLLLQLAVPASADDVERGREVFALAGGCGCHNMADGTIGSGGRELPTPFGMFYGTNITPDPETGIGAWSDAEIIAAIRDGYARGKGVEAPVMPYYQYAGMSDADVRALVAYLRTLPPVRRVNRAADVSLPFPRLAYRAWRLLFAPRGTAPAETPTEALARGRYLVDHVSICGDCHTPRDRYGVFVPDLYLAGTDEGPDGKPVPNITPDAATGLAKWREGSFVRVLESGMLPNADNVQGLMAEVVDGYGGPGYADAPESELRSIAKYMKSVPPIEHDVGD